MARRVAAGWGLPPHRELPNGRSRQVFARIPRGNPRARTTATWNQARVEIRMEGVGGEVTGAADERGI